MSGGRFNYVSVKDIEGPSEDHDSIVDALAEYPDTGDIVTTARHVLAKWREVMEMWERLSPVLKAVEWHQSGDWGEDSVAKAIESMRSRPR